MSSILQLHPLLRIAVSMAAGIFAGYETMGTIPQWMWLAGVIVAVALTLATTRWALAQGVSILLAAAMAGGFLVSRKARATDTPLPRQAVTYEAVVASRPQQGGRVTRMDLWIVGNEALPRRVKASILIDSLHPAHRPLTIGDGLQVTSVLESPTNYFPSHFDYPLYLRCHGYTATTFIRPEDWHPAAVPLTTLSRTDRTILAAMRFRQQILDRYLSQIGDDEDMAVAMAMTMGDKSRLTREMRDVYSISGASHVLALSGLHLGIIYVLLSLMVGSRRWGVLRELLVIVGIWSYAVVTGLSPSVVRASTMITIYAATTLLRRNRMSLNALSLTAIIMLTVNPLCLYDVGFQMSWIAVFSILVLYKGAHSLIRSDYLQSHRIGAWAWAMVVVSCCAQIGVAPLTAHYFGRFSVYFLLTNFIVIPLATLIIYTTAALMVSTLYGPAMTLTASILTYEVKLQNALVSWVSSLPGASIEGIDINRWQVMLIYVLIAAIVVVIHRLVRRGKTAMVRN